MHEVVAIAVLCLRLLRQACEDRLAGPLGPSAPSWKAWPLGARVHSFLRWAALCTNVVQGWNQICDAEGVAMMARARGGVAAWRRGGYIQCLHRFCWKSETRRFAMMARACRKARCCRGTNIRYGAKVLCLLRRLCRFIGSGAEPPILVGYVTEAASFAHAPRTRRRFGKFCLRSSKLCLRSQVKFA